MLEYSCPPGPPEPKALYQTRADADVSRKDSRGSWTQACALLWVSQAAGGSQGPLPQMLEEAGRPVSAPSARFSGGAENGVTAHVG